MIICNKTILFYKVAPLREEERRPEWCGCRLDKQAVSLAVQQFSQ
jgi:hypothetical protein